MLAFIWLLIISIVVNYISAASLEGFDAASLKGFDDTTLYQIRWPGSKGYDNQAHTLLEFDKKKKEVDEREIKEANDSPESMHVVSNDKEEYECILPQLKEKEKTNDEDYNGPNPIELLIPVFQQNSCTSLLESYWTYELCHGKYIRQYHEEREGTKVKLQEYYLGRWDSVKTQNISSEFDRLRNEGKQVTPPKKKLDGISLPYLQLNFTDGTICDLNDKPRKTNVLYVCFTGGKNDIFVIKETSTCEYEVIVISAELCKHPKYRPQVTIENEIKCLPKSGAPKKPLGLAKMEAEGFKQRHLSTFGGSKNDMFAVYSIDEFKDKDGRMQVRVELRPLENEEIDTDLPSALEDGTNALGTNEGPVEEEDDPIDAMIHSPGQPNENFITSPITNTPLKPPILPVKEPDIPMELRDFLDGLACLHGGQDWWKYKFCFGRSIEQYHIEKKMDGYDRKIGISLGSFDREAHIAWIEKNPNKRPRPIESRTFLFYYFTNGDICKETGKPRETQVKLKCIAKKGTVSMYLLEPQLCQYILGVDSPLVCDFINEVDEYGLPLPHLL